MTVTVPVPVPARKFPYERRKRENAHIRELFRDLEQVQDASIGALEDVIKLCNVMIVGGLVACLLGVAVLMIGWYWY